MYNVYVVLLKGLSVLTYAEESHDHNRVLEPLLNKSVPEKELEDSEVSAIDNSTIQSVLDLDLIKQHQKKDLTLREVKEWLLQGKLPN